MLSIALIHLFHEVANKASSWTGGSDGLSGIAPDPIFGLFEFDLWGRTAYLFGIALAGDRLCCCCVFLCARPSACSAGASRQDPLRISAMGASAKASLIKMYVISGAVAGVGGAFNAVSTQVVGLDSLSFTNSAEALVMLVLGGTGSLYGAFAGTVVFMLFEDYCVCCQSLPLADHRRRIADRRRAVCPEGSLRHCRYLR